MLSAFRPQAIHELKPLDKSKLESLLAYGDRLLVGLSTGTLRIYRVNETPSSPDDVLSENGEVPTSSPKKGPKAVELLQEDVKFSKKPVQQLAIVKEANLLISLSDGLISLHDLQTYRMVERLERTKGATCFAVTSNVVKDVETNVPSLVSRLAVGVKRKVVMWTWQDMELLVDVVEVSLESSIKSLTWATGTMLFAGMDPGFSVVNITTQEVTPVIKSAIRVASEPNNAGELAGVRFGAVSSSGMGYMGMGNWVPRPMATALMNEQVLLAKDVNTLFTDAEGKTLEKRQIPWHLAPEAIGYSYPYLLALQPPEKGTLHIRNPDTLSLLQTIAVPEAKILHVPQPNISLAHAGKGFLVASERTIWRMNALPYDTQLQRLIERQRFDEATSLLNLLEDTLIDDKAGQIRETECLKAEWLFSQQKYLLSLDLFTDAQAAVERVVKLYPKSISGESCGISEPTGAGETENVSGTGTGRPEEPALEPPSTPSKGLLSRFTGGQPRKDSDAASTAGLPPARADTDLATPTKQSTSVKQEQKPLEGEDLKTAVRCLCSFLAQARQTVQKYINKEDGSLKESPPTLDSETGKPAFANLMTQARIGAQSSQGIDWHAELLKVAGLVDTTLFRAYMLVSPTLAGPLFRVDNFCDPEVVQSSLYEHDRYSDLIDFLHGKKLHRQALEMLAKFGKDDADAEVPENMKGPPKTVAYLRQLPPELIDLILEFARWPVERDAEVGMEIFLADSDNAERLPRKQVLDFLGSINDKLKAQYLEHVVNELGEQGAEFHQQLVDLYLEELKSHAMDADRQGIVQNKLESFLRNSKSYHKAKTLRQLPADEALLYESRAIVLSAMGSHKQALSIYVFQIQDFAKAEEYCNQIFLAEQAEGLPNPAEETERLAFRQAEPDDSAGKVNIFATLLGLYLRPPPGEEKRWPQALDLLSKHGARLPASSTLDLMPDDLAVQQLTDYFLGRMRHATSVSREEKIIRKLEGVRRENAERVLLLGTDADQDVGRNGGRNRRFRITEEDHCVVCHKRFGASAVRVYPDGTVVHYGCMGKMPTEGGNGGARRPLGSVVLADRTRN